MLVEAPQHFDWKGSRGSRILRGKLLRQTGVKMVKAMQPYPVERKRQREKLREQMNLLSEAITLHDTQSSGRTMQIFAPTHAISSHQ